MPEITIFKVSQKDIRSVVDLVKPQVNLPEVRIFKLIESRLSSETHLLLLAKIGGEAAGVLEGTILTLDSLSGAVKSGQISSLFVAPSHRRKGVARRLIEISSFWFKNNQVESVAVPVAESQGETRTILSRLGFTPGEIRYVRPLP